ncbi:polyprenyl diphosphate synthase [Thermincola potens]|uniref:Di-trans-poly-cis-decaprenylcistransferase n=1 Tax=Thermincola potens (strain JR) TaxID=635013 RepID=D5XDE7_THEPJ|nr:polyprenyl diphosphate synthase [Thermincola potens]ADG81795.1 Di-trans-poly-cis-decaprenylcistransferase [Thermincola potens JR]
MTIPVFKRLPRHIGVIPDGNRRWAEKNGLPKEAGYSWGIAPGFYLYELASELGIEEMTFYGFTHDNTKRPTVQKRAFQKACVDAVFKLLEKDAALLVVGNTESPAFPRELLPFTKKRVNIGKGGMRVNFLVNYGWHWDLYHGMKAALPRKSAAKHVFHQSLASADISRIDLVIRWGGRRRLSGFLPVQTIYADFFIVDDLWPDFKPEHFYNALRWYEVQDITLGG